MVNCNPETVSTDYDTADRLYFEPLTFEDVMAIIERERSAGGEVSCVVQFGGQTPLKLALALQEAGVDILGTSPDSIDLAEDRQRFSQLLWDLGVPQPASGTAVSRERGARGGRAGRLSGGRAAVVRARRPRHGDRVRRRRARSLHDRRRGRVARPPGADRPVPRGRVRVRRRCGGRSPPAPWSSAASWSTSRRRASTPATARAWCRRSWWPSATSARSASTRGASRAR